MEFDPTIFKSDETTQQKVKTWHIYYMKWVSETKLTVAEMMQFRKTQFDNLEDEFKITNELCVTFGTRLFIGNLSFLFKSLCINQSHCGHCVGDIWLISKDDQPIR